MKVGLSTKSYGAIHNVEFIELLTPCLVGDRKSKGLKYNFGGFASLVHLRLHYKAFIT